MPKRLLELEYLDVGALSVEDGVSERLSFKKYGGTIVETLSLRFGLRFLSSAPNGKGGVDGFSFLACSEDKPLSGPQRKNLSSSSSSLSVREPSDERSNAKSKSPAAFGNIIDCREVGSGSKDRLLLVARGVNFIFGNVNTDCLAGESRAKFWFLAGFLNDAGDSPETTNEIGTRLRGCCFRKGDGIPDAGE